jgi:hypothetical protein
LSRAPWRRRKNRARERNYRGGSASIDSPGASCDAAGHRVIDMSHVRPIFTPRLVTPASEWCVLVTWPNDHAEPVGGFKCLPEAEDWISHNADAWLADRLHAVPGS